MPEDTNFAELMSDAQGTQGTRKSLREVLREERIREGRTEHDIEECNKMVRRGGGDGQFTTP